MWVISRDATVMRAIAGSVSWTRTFLEANRWFLCGLGPGWVELRSSGSDEGPGRGGGGATAGEASSGRGGIGGAGESQQRRMKKPHGTPGEHHIGVLQSSIGKIIIMVRWGIHPMAQDKAMDSLCSVILQLEEHPSGSESRKGRGEAAPICPPLHWLKGIRQICRQQHG